MKNWVFAFVFVSLSVSAHAQQDPIKLGVLLDTSTPLIVFFMEEEPKARNLWIWGSWTAGIATGIDAYRTGAQSTDLAERLRVSVGNTVDRREVYQRELTAKLCSCYWVCSFCSRSGPPSSRLRVSPSRRSRWWVRWRLSAPCLSAPPGLLLPPFCPRSAWVGIRSWQPPLRA